ncbi:MAG TPA: WD40 repeat domain-containing protein [Beijerinckiaceae bacterium]|nr:WD40 repeat domain-containing protein [Beijerinckiaceae bacterium]
MAGQNDTLTRHVVAIATGEHVTAAVFLGEAPALALGDGSIRLGWGQGARAVPAHPDAAILVAAADGRRMVTGGDDGRVVLTDAEGGLTVLAEEPGRWIDAVALGPNGSAAWSFSRTVRARDAKGTVRSLAAPSSSRGLAFAPKGYRLALSHVDGASLWFPNTEAAPEKLDWKGVHLDITWSPDGRFVVSSMQENQLHGWRLPEKTHMRMSGYPAKTRSLSWSSDGEWLATSGAEAAIIWPFSGTGPMGKAPRECGVRPHRVTRCAFHPKALVLAIGYEDGLVMLVRLTDASELLVRNAEAGGAITALAWDGAGNRLLFGTEDGAAGLLTLPGS